MNRRISLGIFRAFFGVLALVAVGSQLVVHVQHHYSVVNFFSYFTNLSNIIAAIVLLLGAYMLRREPEQTDTPRFDLVRATAVVAMALVGIVYGVLLRNEDLGSLMPWVNVVVHYVMPVVMVLDWLYKPPHSPLSQRQIGFVLIYPLVYLVYTVSRGAVLGWYPYPFLNPSKAGGYGEVALYCVAIFIAFLVVGWLLIGVRGILQRRMAIQPA